MLNQTNIHNLSNQNARHHILSPEQVRSIKIKLDDFKKQIIQLEVDEKMLSAKMDNLKTEASYLQAMIDKEEQLEHKFQEKYQAHLNTLNKNTKKLTDKHDQ